MNDALDHTDAEAIDTAVLLASSGVFDGAAGGASVTALTRLCGMTMLQRTLCALQRAGIAQALILAGEEEPALRSRIRGDRRIRMALRWFPAREFAPWEPRTWETVTREVRGACLILGCHLVFPLSLLDSLREKGRDGKAVVTVGQPGEPGWKANPGVRWRFDPHQRDGRVPRVVFADHGPSELDAMAGDVNGLASAIDLVVMPARFFQASDPRPRAAAGAAGPVQLALERAAAEGALRVLSAASHGCRDLRQPGGARRAARLLFDALQRAPDTMDGVVDRYVNRRISRWISRLFLLLRCPPSVITVLSMLCGLLGASYFAMGSYQAGMIGAVLFHGAVILDCCDGEVARLTFAESRFGRGLDLAADNLVHAAIFAGIAWGVYRTGPWQADRLPLIAGAAAIVFNVVSLWGVWRVKALKAHAERWRQVRPAIRARVDVMLERVANRDFSVVALACAWLGALHWLLWLGAVGAGVFAALMVWHVCQARRCCPA